MLTRFTIVSNNGDNRFKFQDQNCKSYKRLGKGSLSLEVITENFPMVFIIEHIGIIVTCACGIHS